MPWRCRPGPRNVACWCDFRTGNPCLVCRLAGPAPPRRDRVVPFGPAHRADRRPPHRLGARSSPARRRRCFAGRTFAAVLTSPLVRARRTAELAGLAGAETEPRLVEWDYGGYEGLTTPEIRARVGYAWTVFANGVVPGRHPRGDRAGRRRAGPRRDRPRPAPAGEGDVALVGHGHALRVLASVFLEQDPCFGAQLVLDAGSVSVLGHEHGVPCRPELEPHARRRRSPVTRSCRWCWTTPAARCSRRPRGSARRRCHRSRR